MTTAYPDQSVSTAEGPTSGAVCALPMLLELHALQLVVLLLWHLPCHILKSVAAFPGSVAWPPSPGRGVLRQTQSASHALGFLLLLALVSHL